MSCVRSAPASGSPRRSRSDSPPSGRMGDPQTARRTETVFEKIDLSPHHEDALFRDVAIPADLPVFTIKDRRVDGSNLPEPFDGDRGGEALEELAARVADQERRYDILDVEARVVLRQYPRPEIGPIVQLEWMREERSIVRGDLAYLASRYHEFGSANGSKDGGSNLTSFDGLWVRQAWDPGAGELQQPGACLRGRR